MCSPRLTALIAGLIMAAASGAVDFRTVTNGTLLFDVILVVVLGGIPLAAGGAACATSSSASR